MPLIANLTKEQKAAYRDLKAKVRDLLNDAGFVTQCLERIVENADSTETVIDDHNEKLILQEQVYVYPRLVAAAICKRMADDVASGLQKNPVYKRKVQRYYDSM